MSTTFPPLPSVAAAPPALADAADVRPALLVLRLSTLLALLTDCLKVGAVVLKVPELVAVVAIYVAEVSPCCLHGDPASSDNS